MAQTLLALGRLQLDLGGYSKAEPYLRRALAIQQATLGPDHREVAQSLYHLGRLYAERKQYAQARTVLTRAATIQEKVLAPDHPEGERVRRQLAAVTRTTRPS